MRKPDGENVGANFSALFITQPLAGRGGSTEAWEIRRPVKMEDGRI